MKVDMHVHTSKSDGRDSVHNVIEAAEKKGLDLDRDHRPWPGPRQRRHGKAGPGNAEGSRPAAAVLPRAGARRHRGGDPAHGRSPAG